MSKRKTFSDLASITENFKKNMESMKESFTNYSKPLPKMNDIWIHSSGNFWQVITVFEFGKSGPFVLCTPVVTKDDESDIYTAPIPYDEFVKNNTFAFNAKDLYIL